MRQCSTTNPTSPKIEEPPESNYASQFPAVDTDKERRSVMPEEESFLAIDPGRIFQHYESSRDYQHRQLGNCNLPE